jgi:hypothetical protein
VTDRACHHMSPRVEEARVPVITATPQSGCLLCTCCRRTPLRFSFTNRSGHSFVALASSKSSSSTSEGGGTSATSGDARRLSL